MRRDKRKRETEAVAVSLQKGTHVILDAVICIYMLLILAVLPFYNREGYTHIGTDKSFFFFKAGIMTARAAVPLLVLYLSFSIKNAWRKKGNFSRFWMWVRENMSVIDWFAAAYAASVILSYAFSRYKSDALWGASGWYMGLCRQLLLVGTYFFISKMWIPKKWVFYTVLPASAVVFLLGYLNRFDIFPQKFESYGPSFISTVGNLNWYCGYQVSVFFAGMVLLWQGISYKIWQRLLLMLYLLLGFASMVTQGSSSGIAAMAVICLAMFCMSVSDSDRMCRFWQEMVLLGGAILLTYGITVFTGRKINYMDLSVSITTSKEAGVFVTVVSLVLLLLATVDRKRKSHLGDVWYTLESICVILGTMLLLGYAVALIANTISPGCIGVLSEYPAFTFSNEWGSYRGATWKAGAYCFLEQDCLHKLAGVGPDAMAAYIYHDGSPQLQEIVTLAFPTARLTNAHNEWLTILADMGILGLISYMGLMLSGMARLMGRKSGNLISCACGFCLLGYTVNNLFSFQQSLNTATIFVILGIGEAFYRKESCGRGQRM